MQNVINGSRKRSIQVECNLYQSKFDSATWVQNNFYIKVKILQLRFLIHFKSLRFQLTKARVSTMRLKVSDLDN